MPPQGRTPLGRTRRIFQGGQDTPRIHNDDGQTTTANRQAQQPGRAKAAPGRGSTTAGSRGRSSQGKPVKTVQQARSWLRMAAHKESHSRPGPREASNDQDRTSIKTRKGGRMFFDKRVGRPSELQRLFKLWCLLVAFGVSKSRGCLHRVSPL